MNEAFHLFDRKQSPGKRIALVLAVMMHILLALFLIYGVRWQTTMPEAVEVSLVRSVPNIAPKAEPTPDPAPEVTPPPEPKPAPPLPKVAPPPKPVVAPPKPDIAIKEKVKEKPEPAKPMFDPMAMLKHEEQQTKQEQERKRLNDMLAKEDSGKTAAAATTANKKSSEDYIAKVRGKVLGNMGLMPGIAGNPEVEYQVKLLPSGELLELRMVKSSGNTAWDGNTERAIRRSLPFAKPERPEERILNLKFRPIE